MSAKGEDQLPTEETLLNEGWQRDILTDQYDLGPAPLPASTHHHPHQHPHGQYAAMAPSYGIDGQMSVSTYPPLSSPMHPPVTSHILPSNLSSRGHPTPVPTVPPAAQTAALRFQSQTNQIAPWLEDFYGFPTLDNDGHAPIVEPSEGFEYLLSTSEATPAAIPAETVPTTAIQGYVPVYATPRMSSPWDFSPTQPPLPISLASTRPSGPDRSKKSKGKRMDPLAGTKGPSYPVVKRAAACWRCRKYRKPCDDELVCSSCQVGNFRVWPPALGCRRDNLEAFALAIIPPSAEDLLRTLPPGMVPKISWRLGVAQKLLTTEDLFSDPSCQAWSPLAVKVHSTGLYGQEFADLLNIVKTYQDAQRVKNPVLESTCTLASSSCDFYSIFVCSAGDHQLSPPASDIATIIQQIRTSMARSLSLFLGHCVSSKRADWFPSVLSFAVFVASVAMFMDAAVAMPVAARTGLWDDVASFCRGLRAQLYPTALDLLRIRANNDKQMAPLKLKCWSTTLEPVSPPTTATPLATSDPEPTPPAAIASTNKSPKFPEGEAPERTQPRPKPTSPITKSSDVDLHPTYRTVRNPEGMLLVGNDESAFDGFQSLQTWLNTNEPMLKQGKILFSNDPFTSPTVAAICTLAPIFGVT